MVVTAQGGKSLARSALQMRDLEAQVKTCQLCRLAKTRTNAVPGEGNLKAEVMFIGEGPGYHEDKQGRPFIGAAGHFLDELLSIAGLSRENAYIANVVKCRPPNNRDPNPDEMAACAPYLERQIEIVNPRLIVTLGRYSMSKFFPGERISQIHGQARIVDGRLCVAMYHPAAGLHQASLADIIRADFRKLPVFMEEAQRVMGPSPNEVDRERMAEAEAAREFVVHNPETGAVLERVDVHAPAPPSAEASAEIPTNLAVSTVPATEGMKAAPPAAKSKKAVSKNDDYQQMSFFDL